MSSIHPFKTAFWFATTILMKYQSKDLSSLQIQTSVVLQIHKYAVVDYKKQFCFYLFLKDLIYFRERASTCEHLHVWTGGWPWSHNPEIMTWAEIKSQMLNPLSHAGPLTKIILKETQRLQRCGRLYILYCSVSIMMLKLILMNALTTF